MKELPELNKPKKTLPDLKPKVVEEKQDDKLAAYLHKGNDIQHETFADAFRHMQIDPGNYDEETLKKFAMKLGADVKIKNLREAGVSEEDLPYLVMRVRNPRYS